MANPAGNYPGRQIFVGALESGEEAFVYFGSGRSKGSQARFASPFLPEENAVRIKPIDPKEPFDQFRHYQAIKIDPKTGTAVISNSQAPVDAVLEVGIYVEDEKEVLESLSRIIGAIGLEYDSKEKPTSRIVGLIQPKKVAALAITDRKNHAVASVFCVTPGHLSWVPTYNGEIEYKNFLSFDLSAQKYVVQTSATGAQQLADEIYDMSDHVDEKYGELRVWSVAGVRNGKGPGGWEIARKNRHQIE